MHMRNKQRGSQTLEFTLVGLPLIFILFSIANMSFSMMTMHTMQEAVEQGARMVSTRGSTCSSGGNTCTVTVQQIADFIASNAAGISPQNLKVTLQPAGDSANTITCDKLNSCQSSCSGGCNTNRTTVWPASTNSDNSPGKDIIITADCSVASPIYMFWAGVTGGEASNGSTFHAYTRQRMMF